MKCKTGFKFPFFKCNLYRCGEDEKVVKNVQRKLATELQRLSQVFRKMQKDYLVGLALPGVSLVTWTYGIRLSFD
jgi:hypothetical protein